jgi:molecular chaperone HscB
MIDFSRNYFDLFGLPMRFRFDAAVLDAAYRKLQTQVHPDRFAAGTDAERRAALQSSARVNEAYRALKDPVQRAQYLLRLHGIEAVGETDTQLPFEFLEQQLERREAAGDALAAGDTRTLTALRELVNADAREIEDRLALQLDGEHAYADARTHVRELTFLAKLAGDLDTMLGTLDD